jgi:urea transport system permease protein
MSKILKYDLVALLVLFIIVLFGFPTFLGFDGYELNLYSRYLSLGIVSMALALSWGTTGILNLGQAATFGIGSYIMAMHLKIKGSADLPDFMVWNNVDVLPWFWVPFHSLSFTLVAGLLIPALVGGLIGVFMFRARISGVFVAVITLAFLVAFQLLVVNYQGYTGGQNGLTGLAPLTLFGWTVDTYSIQFYYLVAGCLIAALVIGLYLVHSKFGLILRAIREDANRTRFFGYNVASYETVIFCISAALAGWSGMLYTIVLQFASPTYMSVSFSLGIVIWCAVGGRNSVIAAAVGAIIVNILQGKLSDVYVEGWHMMLGATFVLVVLFMPRGLHGLVGSVWHRLSQRKADKKPQTALSKKAKIGQTEGGR